MCSPCTKDIRESYQRHKMRLRKPTHSQVSCNENNLQNSSESRILVSPKENNYSYRFQESETNKLSLFMSNHKALSPVSVDNSYFEEQGFFLVAPGEYVHHLKPKLNYLKKEKFRLKMRRSNFTIKRKKVSFERIDFIEANTK